MVALSVEAIVGQGGQVGGVREVRGARENALGEGCVGSNLLALEVRERTWLVPDTRAHPDPPDVMEQSRPP